MTIVATVFGEIFTSAFEKNTLLLRLLPLHVVCVCSHTCVQRSVHGLVIVPTHLVLVKEMQKVYISIYTSRGSSYPSKMHYESLTCAESCRACWCMLPAKRVM